MIKAIVRSSILAGAAYGAYFLARRYFGSDFDKALDSAKSTVKDIAGDITRKDKAVTGSVESEARRAM
jgi:hypothetical protein